MQDNDRPRQEPGIPEQPTGTPTSTTVDARLRRVEALLERLTVEVRTQSVVLCGPAGDPRAVAEVVDEQVELRLELTSQPEVGAPRGSLVLFACPGSGGLGPLAGLQIWAGGTVVASFEAWSDGEGGWNAAVHPAPL